MSKKQFVAQAACGALLMLAVAVEPASADIGTGLADQIESIIKPLLLVCAAVMGFGAMLKGDWKTLGGCLLMLLIVGSLIYGPEAWESQMIKFAESIGG